MTLKLVLHLLRAAYGLTIITTTHLTADRSFIPVIIVTIITAMEGVLLLTTTAERIAQAHHLLITAVATATLAEAVYHVIPEEINA